MIDPNTMELLEARIDAADRLYGEFSSSHEAMGVCLEEWDEFRAEVKKNDIFAAQYEALDLAAALIRFHDQLTQSAELRKRSGMDLE